MAESHMILGGQVRIYKRERSGYWQCSAYIGGKKRRETTGTDSLSHAKEIAEDWYLSLRGKLRAGEIKVGKTFAFVAETFLREFSAMTEGTRSPSYLASQERRVRGMLIPAFDGLLIGEITASKVQDYRFRRASNAWTGRPTSRSTLHQEIVALRQILKTAVRHGWIASLPDLSPPYKMAGKIGHRAWFSPEEYRQLYEATRRRAAQPLNNRWKWECEQIHDYVLFVANTGLRPDEASRLQFRDVTPIYDEATREEILLIEVRGKRGVGYCKSTASAVRPFNRLSKRMRTFRDAQGEIGRRKPEPTDLLFPGGRRDLFNNVLDELNLKFDRDGNRRTAYSLRHTYICMRLTEGADIYQIAKNCRTSVEMIEKFYATHIRTALDAAAINVRRRKTPRNAKASKAKGPRPKNSAWRTAQSAVLTV